MTQRQDSDAGTPTAEPASVGLSGDRGALSETDIGLVRVLEDLIDVLISKGVLQFTELPAAAQAKLLERRTARAGLQDPLRLLDPDNDSL